MKYRVYALRLAILALLSLQCVVTGTPRQSQMKVKGRIEGLPSGMPAGLVRAAMLTGGRQDGSGWKMAAKAELADDGAFAFANVSPGRYRLRATDFRGTPLSDDQTIEVTSEKDLDGIVWRARRLVVGKVGIEGGVQLPLALFDGGPENPDAESVVMVAVGPRGLNGEGPSIVRKDGYFAAPVDGPVLPIVVAMLPIGYAVKSISYDGIDLPGVERNIVQIVQNRVEVVLAKKRSPAFTVSGRVLSAVGTYSASRPIVRMQSVASSNSGKRQPKLVWTPQSVGGTAYAALAPDGTFAFQQVPVGTYSVGESNSIEVTDHDVTGLEVQLFGGKKKGDLNSPESQALFFRIQLVAAANSVDCGVYDAYVPGSDAVMECIDTAMRQNRPFTVISTFAGTDTLSVGGFFRDSSGAIQVLNGCLLMCSGWIVEPCSSPRKLFSNRGILVCEQPLGAMPLWPPPKSNAEGK